MLCWSCGTKNVLNRVKDLNYTFMKNIVQKRKNILLKLKLSYAMLYPTTFVGYNIGYDYLKFRRCLVSCLADTIYILYFMALFHECGTKPCLSGFAYK